MQVVVAYSLGANAAAYAAGRALPAERQVLAAPPTAAREAHTRSSGIGRCSATPASPGSWRCSPGREPP
jgi:hypothetical protein